MKRIKYKNSEVEEKIKMAHSATTFCVYCKMAGIQGSNLYSKEYEDALMDLNKREQPRIRPNELNVQPIMSFTPKLKDDDSSEEGTKTPKSLEKWMQIMNEKGDSDVRKHVGVSVNVATLIAENVLSHPFLVLRRQCQVHHNSRKNHILAVTLVPVVVRLHNRQGFTTLWKGLGSTLLIRGMSIAIEDLLSKITPWPKEFTWHSSFKSFGQHILLKCVSFAIMTPFYSASLVETVQSDIASEKPGVFDVFKDGMCRLVSWGSPQKGRMLPVWALIVPTVVYGLLKHLFSMVIKNVASRVIYLRNRSSQEKRGALHKDILNQAASEEIEATSAFIGMISADFICYPLETILHRLYLQGTRTIVDNLDSGMGVIPILTNYEGIADCYESTISQEGVLGLYKGFGALVLQYAVQWAVIKLTKLIVTEISILLRPSPKPKRPEFETDLRPTPTPVHPLTSPYQYNDSFKTLYAPSYPYSTP